jgi:hypothetical protein
MDWITNKRKVTMVLLQIEESFFRSQSPETVSYFTVSGAWERAKISRRVIYWLL